MFRWGGGSCQKDMSVAASNGKSLSSLSGSVDRAFWFSRKFSPIWPWKRCLQYKAATAYSPPEVFVYHLWSIWVMLPPTGLRAGKNGPLPRWNGLAFWRFGTERRWASDGGMMCIYNCIFVIICMTFYEDDYVYYVCDMWWIRFDYRWQHMIFHKVCMIYFSRTKVYKFWGVAFYQGIWHLTSPFYRRPHFPLTLDITVLLAAPFPPRTKL